MELWDQSPWETLFWTAFTRASNPMAVLDAQRVRIAVNPALCDYLQRPRSELIGRRADESVTEHARAELDASWKRNRQSGLWTGESEHLRADGAILYSHYAARTMELGGRTVVLLTMLAGEPTVALPDGVRSTLSPRERTVLHLLTLGLSSAEIAERMAISAETVRTHVRNAMRKTGARTRAQLVADALSERSRNGVGEPPKDATTDRPEGGTG
jgi:PAS domain S-box-containing protein